MIRRLAAERVRDEIRRCIVRAVPVCRDLFRKIKENTFLSVFIKQNHRFENGAARHSEEGAGFAQSDVVFMQGMNEKFRLFFRAFKDARIAEQTICFEHSPERVFATPDIPVPVAFPSEQRFGFCNVCGENVHRVAVGP